MMQKLSPTVWSQAAIMCTLLATCISLTASHTCLTMPGLQDCSSLQEGTRWFMSLQMTRT